MKKTILILSFFSIFTNFVSAQLPNGGFENWTGNEADGWVSANGLMILGNPQSVFKTGVAHLNSYACEINTIHVTNKPAGVPEYVGSVFTGKQQGMTPLFGFPFSGKPQKLVFWYKYTPQTNDSASVLILTKKWNSTKGTCDTLSFTVSFFATTTVSIYTKLELPITYFDTTRAPDTALIIFSASTTVFQQAGAKLTIDDVAFEGGNTGVSDIDSKAQTVKIYPNPANDMVQLAFLNADEPVSVNISDLSGKLLWQNEIITTNFLTINTAPFPKGFYTIQIKNRNGVLHHKLILQ